jgi:transcriptional regulator GlxA family with amidase domain
MLNIVELFLDPRGVPTWHTANKMPIFSKDNEVIGVMGTLRAYEAKTQVGVTNRSLLRAYEHIRTHCAEKISIPALAADCRLSVRQFQRRFREQVWMSPRELLIKMRVEMACGELRRPDASLSSVACSCGFYDQSALTRQFSKHVGLTPARYRKRYG